MRPNKQVGAIALSTTLALDARAKELIAKGRDVVNMSVGEPDFDAPAAVQEAAVGSVRGGKVRYTPAEGTPALRQAIAKHLKETRGIEYLPSEITVCHSAKHALSGTLLSLIEPGDEVLMLLPAWVSYVEIVRYAGGVPVLVEPRADLGPDLAAIERATSARTRGILLNSPCNPTGYTMTQAEVRAIAALAEARDLWIVSDEIYRRLVYEGEANLSPASISPSLRARTAIIDGASKAFAMTGYRIGFVAAPAPVAAAVGRLHSQLTGCPNAVSQAAYLAALSAEPPEVARMCDEFKRRRDHLVAGLVGLGLPTPVPRGAFYTYSDISALCDERGSKGFCEDLLERENLAVVPGSAFELDGWIRLSYATSLEQIDRALERLGRFVASRRQRATPSTR
jgi:aspartate aminotransferase